ncbi:MAG TPA: prepilin-type N-terminal cleavage/methylation domain-containing protein [Burkholderiales bacterium]|nr:prepilin-type N-terminal cleavage/methylation domain-containing protein [Burkholderiales bacterium]
MNRNQNQGFTLIEIAIVLVIIGLLLGGVLKGQELITSARVRNLISQQDGIKAAFFGFQDRFRALPGDYTAATTNITGAGGNGNGNGQIEPLGTVITGSKPQEDVLTWDHLSHAGFINGSYTFAAAPTDNPPSNPKNPYSIYLQLVYDSTWGVGGNTIVKHNLKTGSQVPVEILAEVDRKIDDGLPYNGGFQFSAYDAGTGNVPAVGATSTSPNCVNTSTVPPSWTTTSGTTNCGAASLF